MAMTPTSVTTAGFPSGKAGRGAAVRHLHPVRSMRRLDEPIAAEVGKSAPVPTYPSRGLPVPATVTVLTAVDGDAAAHEPAVSSLREQLATHGGVELDTASARFAAVFPSARRAVLCAIGLQRTLAGRAAARPEEPLRLRIALHTGEASTAAADPLGRLAELAGRIASHARGGEIVVSAALRELAGSEAGLRFGPARSLQIDGLMDPCTVYEACWAGNVGTPEMPGDVFRREGDYWTIAWRGGRCRLRDLRGFHYLAQLLRHPGRDFHA